MLLELAVAAIIGISFGNAWACILLSFGASAERKKAGLLFIAGRFLGLILLGSVISLLRFAASDIMPTVLMVFGVSTILFGIFMIVGHLNKTKHPKRYSNPLVRMIAKGLNFLSPLSVLMVFPQGKKCQGGYGPKSNGHHGKGQHHGGEGKCKTKRILQGRLGLGLGLLRGATPCAKIVVLTPLLVSFGFPNSLPLIIVYALTSTIYPVIGYLSADVVSKFERYRFVLVLLGALILIALGIYSIAKVFMMNPAHLGP